MGLGPQEEPTFNDLIPASRCHPSILKHHPVSATTDNYLVTNHSRAFGCTLQLGCDGITSVQCGVQSRYTRQGFGILTARILSSLYLRITSSTILFLYSIMKLQNTVLIVFWTALLQSSFAANCNLKPSYPAPIVANGWQAQLVAQGLKSPRSIVFDSNGGLLVVQQGNGIVHLQLTGGGGACFNVAKKTTLIDNSSVSDP